MGSESPTPGVKTTSLPGAIRRDGKKGGSFRDKGGTRGSGKGKKHQKKHSDHMTNSAPRTVQRELHLKEKEEKREITLRGRRPLGRSKQP